MLRVCAAALLAASACGLPGVTNAPPAQARHFTVKVTGDKAQPDHLQAFQDDTITITLQADKNEEIHLHGYDVAFEVGPGKPVTKTFKADRTGTFEYEIEGSGTHLGDLVVEPR